MKNFDYIENILFDCDGVLYHQLDLVFGQVSKRMTKYISKKLNIDMQKAKELQTNYFHKYNTSLNGLMIHHDIPPKEFLDYVHDVEHPELEKNDQLISKIRILEGKKIIFTNATLNHAKKILKILELEHDFDQIIDIKDLEYIPKPDKRSYKKLLECLNLNKENLDKTIFFEDTVKNLIPAKELGITTVWMKNSINEKDFMKNCNFIDYSFNSLNEFLDTIKMRG